MNCCSRANCLFPLQSSILKTNVTYLHLNIFTLNIYIFFLQTLHVFNSLICHILYLGIQCNIHHTVSSCISIYTTYIFISFLMTSYARVPAGHPPKKERTLIVVKPDGVQRRLVGRIIQRFEQRGFKLVGLKMLQVQNNIFSSPLKFSNSICDEGVRGSAVSPLPSADDQAILSRPGAIHDIWARGCHGECSLLFLSFNDLPSGYTDTGLFREMS